jgi:hypothetical protein
MLPRNHVSGRTNKAWHAGRPDPPGGLRMDLNPGHRPLWSAGTRRRADIVVILAGIPRCPITAAAHDERHVLRISANAHYNSEQIRFDERDHRRRPVSKKGAPAGGPFKATPYQCRDFLVIKDGHLRKFEERNKRVVQTAEIRVQRRPIHCQVRSLQNRRCVARRSQCRLQGSGHSPRSGSQVHDRR